MFEILPYIGHDGNNFVLSTHIASETKRKWRYTQLDAQIQAEINWSNNKFDVTNTSNELVNA